MVASANERIERGKNERNRLSRVAHKEVRAQARDFDPIAVLRGSAEGRLKRLLPIKYERMAAGPFAFFRGAVSIMAADLGRLPHTTIDVQLCGDAHVQNLGSFAAPDGKLVFDINDFDETFPGPWEWDIKRLAASLVLAGREAGDSESTSRDAVLEFMARYRESVRSCSELTFLQLARHTVHRHVEAGPILGVLEKARRATPDLTLAKLTVAERSGTRRFKEQKPLLTPVSDKMRRDVCASLKSYYESLSQERRHFAELYSPVDVAFKVVGTGSVGTRDYILLCFGQGPDDPLFLQMKEEPPSAYAKYLKRAAPANQGERVVQGQRLMQAQSDIFLGWTSMEGRDYLVRQLADFKAGVDPTDLRGRGLCDYARACGEVLGKGHARSGDPCVLSGYCGDSDKLDKAIVQFAVAYADQTEADYKALLDAVKKGRLKTMEGVV